MLDFVDSSVTTLSRVVKEKKKEKVFAVRDCGAEDDDDDDDDDEKERCRYAVGS